VTYGNWSNWNRTNRLEAGNIQQCLQDSIKVIVDVKDFV
jgi:Ni2+-binding GTPase involved in maturation of urease and hydrogenase